MPDAARIQDYVWQVRSLSDVHVIPLHVDENLQVLLQSIGHMTEICEIRIGWTFDALWRWQRNDRGYSRGFLG